MDPVKFMARYIGLSDLIFQHFSGENLIMISKVNSNWFEFIKDSKKLRSKIMAYMVSLFYLVD